VRYVLAAAIACLIISAGFTVSWHIHRSFLDRFRQQLRADAAAGKLPRELEGVDLDSVTPEGFDVRVSDAEMTRMQIADLLSHLWFVWAPLVVVVCLGMAWILGPKMR
jgi:hypothetical protein